MDAVDNVKEMVKDGWSNLITGLGSTADKKKYTKHRAEKLISDDELESIYIEDGLGARIVTEMPNDMFREGWDYAFPDLDETKAKAVLDIYKDCMENIGAVAKLKAGFYWARLYGGAVILIGALDGQGLEMPLNPKKIRHFDNLRIIDRSDIDFQKIRFQLDPTKPRYGLPEFYPISFEKNDSVNEIQEVHYSRIIELHGVQVPAGATKRLTKEQRYWGLSILQNADDHLRTMGSSLGSVSSLLDEFSVGKFKLANLADILSQPDGLELMKKRVELNDLARSVYHSMYMDKEDDYIRENVSFSGIPEVLYIYMMMVSSCSGYPITRLFGVSPAGLNSTGESDMRNYYDRVRSEQGAMLEPILLRLVQIISEWKNIEEPYIEFRPLQQLTDKEKSELEKLDAEKEALIASTWKTYIEAGILEPYQAAFLQFGDELDKIPIPEEYQLPAVEPVAEPDDDSNAEPDPANEKDPDSNGEALLWDEEAEERIAELEAKETLSEEEEQELKELKKQVGR